MVNGWRNSFKQSEIVASSTGSFSITSSSSQPDFSDQFKPEKPCPRPYLWTNSLPRNKKKRQPGEWNFYERTESCYDLTTLDFGFKKANEKAAIVRTQSGLIVPPRTKKKSAKSEEHGSTGKPDPPKRCSSKDVLQKTNLVRTQSGQIVPPRLKKSKSQQKVDSTSPRNDYKMNESPKAATGNKIPPTPPKRKKSLLKEVSGKVFMNLVEINGQCGMHINIGDQEQNLDGVKTKELEDKQTLIPQQITQIRGGDEKSFNPNYKKNTVTANNAEKTKKNEERYQNDTRENVLKMHEYQNKMHASNSEERYQNSIQSPHLSYKNEANASISENRYQNHIQRNDIENEEKFLNDKLELHAAIKKKHEEIEKGKDNGSQFIENKLGTKKDDESDSFWKQIHSNMALNYFMKKDLEDISDDKCFEDKNTRESLYINEIDKEAWQKSVDNTYANDNEAEDWKTPRESWRTCSDGYIEAWEVDRLNEFTGCKEDRMSEFMGEKVDTMNEMTGYSRINKSKRSQTSPMLDNKLGITYHSEVTVSYNQVLTTYFSNKYWPMILYRSNWILRKELIRVFMAQILNLRECQAGAFYLMRSFGIWKGYI